MAGASPLSVSGLGSHHLAAAVPLPYRTFNYQIWGPCIYYTQLCTNEVTSPTTGDFFPDSFVNIYSYLWSFLRIAVLFVFKYAMVVNHCSLSLMLKIPV